MRVLVCGGREYADYETVRHVLNRIEVEHGISCIIHGGARGADSLADRWAWDDGLHPVVAVERYLADWQAHGRAAGPIRNQQMLERSSPDVVVAFPGGRGTKDMVDRAKRAGVRVIDMRDRDASEAENAKRLSGEAVAARADRHRQEHVAHTEQGKRNG